MAGRHVLLHGLATTIRETSGLELSRCFHIHGASDGNLRLSCVGHASCADDLSSLLWPGYSNCHACFKIGGLEEMSHATAGHDIG